SLTIHTFCIKQFWTSAKVKKVNDEVRIKALVDGKRVNIKESLIRRILRLDDAEGTSCLTNTDIFEGLARMGAKTTSWNEFSSTMASDIICLATNQKFNFLRYILLSLVKNIEAGVPFFMFPRFVQLIINHKLGDMMHHKAIFATPSLTKTVFANMKRVGTGFSREVTPLFDTVLVQASKEVGILQADAQPIPIPTEPSTSKPQKKHKLKRKHTKEPKTWREVLDIKSTYKSKIEKLESKVERLEEENKVLKELKVVHSTVDFDEPIMKKEESSKQGRKIADIDANVEINLEKVQAEAYNLDLDHQEKVLNMLDVNDDEPTGVEEVVEVFTAAKLITEVVTTVGVDVNAASVQDTPVTAAEATKVIVEVLKLRKRRGVIIQDPEEIITTVTVQPKLEAELNADINWNAVIEKVKRSERLTDAVMKYQALKRKPLTEAQARRNMIIYLKNMAGYKMNYFKGMSYGEIRPLFEKHYNNNQGFINEVNEGIKVSEQEVRQEKEVEVESSKRKDATPLASKILIVDYKILTKRNRPYFKIIRADGNHRERFKKTEPKNYTDDYLLNTLKIMFEKPNVEVNVWKDQKGEYCLAKMYPLTHFTLEQMVNDFRLEVDDESEMSLELLRLVRRQLNEGQRDGSRIFPKQSLPQTIANADGTSTSRIPSLVTTEEKAQKKNNVKARSMLLMALPNEYLLTFNQYKDAKILFEAIQARFCGNDATNIKSSEADV
nr:hypothetical protein [Tanacetum cinerariifolium]